jgi:hypothetical protein
MAHRISGSYAGGRWSGPDAPMVAGRYTSVDLGHALTWRYLAE